MTSPKLGHLSQLLHIMRRCEVHSLPSRAALKVQQAFSQKLQQARPRLQHAEQQATMHLMHEKDCCLTKRHLLHKVQEQLLEVGLGGGQAFKQLGKQQGHQWLDCSSSSCQFRQSSSQAWQSHDGLQHNSSTAESSLGALLDS